MANTIKFGNGQWATKEDSILAYNDENANFKPLPFVTSRATTATRVNKAGLLETVASGVPRVDYLDNSKGSYLLEPSSRNLITQSEAFGNSYWTKSGASIEGDASTAGAEKVVNGDFATDSDWNKGTGWSISGGALVATNVTTQATYQIATIEVGKTYKATFEITQHTEGSVALRVGTSSQYQFFGGVGVYTVYIYNVGGSPQLRFNANGTTTLSIDNISVKEVQGFSAPSVDSPLGAFKLVEDNVNGNHQTYTQSTTVILGESYAFSCFVKIGERSNVSFDGGFRNDLNATFNLNTLATTGGGLIEALSNGWFRLSATGLGTGSTGATNFLVSLLNDSETQSYTGDGTSGIYIFGAQLEQQSYATSYIPTAGSQISRLKDTCFNQPPIGVIGQTELTVFYQGIVNVQTGLDGHAIALSQSADAAGSSRILLFRKNSDNNMYVFIQNSIGQFDTPLLVGTPSSENDRYAIIIKNSILKVYFNGQKVIDKTNGTIPLMQYLYLNEWSDQNINKNRIKNVKLYNTVLSDSEAIALTSN